MTETCPRATEWVGQKCDGLPRLARYGADVMVKHVLTTKYFPRWIRIASHVGVLRKTQQKSRVFT